jgi:autophagy-related protein 11
LDTFEGLGASCTAELEKQMTLLGGLESDLDIIRQVRVHADFVSPQVRKAIETGEKHRTLGDYVSNGKMMQVAETCEKSHGLSELLILTW